MNEHIVSKLKDIMVTILGTEQCYEFENIELLFDSLQFISIILEIENEFSIEIEDEDLVEDYSSISDFVTLVNKYLYSL